MENQLSDPSHSEFTIMAPMTAMMVELQKEIGELRRIRDRNISTDTNDSEADPGSTHMVDIHLDLTPEELALRTYKGLLPTTCHDNRFHRILDYLYYRLHKRSDKYDSSVSSQVSKWTRQLEASFKLRFDGSDPLSIIQFLT
jgi:hypothetical protein